MVLDRSTKTLIAVFTLVASGFLVINHIIDSAPVEDWWLAGLLAAISVGFWVWLWQDERQPRTRAVAPVSDNGYALSAHAGALEPAGRPLVQEWVISRDATPDILSPHDQAVVEEAEHVIALEGGAPAEVRTLEVMAADSGLDDALVTDAEFDDEPTVELPVQDDIPTVEVPATTLAQDEDDVVEVPAVETVAAPEAEPEPAAETPAASTPGINPADGDFDETPVPQPESEPSGSPVENPGGAAGGSAQRTHAEFAEDKDDLADSAAKAPPQPVEGVVSDAGVVSDQGVVSDEAAEVIDASRVRDDILQTPADQQDEVAQAIAEEPLGQAALGEVMAAPETPGGMAASSEAEEAAQQIVSPEATAADTADDRRDNLTLIEGIGPRYQQALYAVGINTFAQLSGASDETLTRAVAGIGVARPASLDTWAEQAAYLARGDRAGFDQLVARLKSGRRADSNQR